MTGISHINDPNFTGDIFLRDTSLGTTRLVSVNLTGVGSGNSYSDDARLTPDGRYVSFESYASNLATNATGGYLNVFLRDLSNGVPEMISVGAGGVAPNGVSLDASLSDNGRFVAFESAASNLGPTDTNGFLDVYVRDRLSGINILCSRYTNGMGNGNGSSFDPIISANGRYIVFESFADNLVPGDTNGAIDVFAYDSTLGTVQLISAAPSSRSGNGGSFLQVYRLNQSMTPNGRYVVFESDASDLTAADTNGLTDVFVRDLVAGTTTLVSMNCSGTGSSDGDSYAPTISADGRFVAFESDAQNLTSGDFSSDEFNIFRRDLFAGTTELVSRNRTSAGGGNNGSYTAMISSDGSGVAFASGASDLVNGDLTYEDDVFVWSGLVTSPSNCAPGIVSQPVSHGVNVGDDTFFSVTVNGCGASYYQWYFTGNLMPGQNLSVLSLFNVTLANAGNYFVVLTNAYGSITSSIATLTVTNVSAGTNSIVSITANGNIPTITFSATPGFTYRVERSTNLVPPVTWVTVWTTNASASLFQFTDPNPATNSAFYRSAHP